MLFLSLCESVHAHACVTPAATAQRAHTPAVSLLDTSDKSVNTQEAGFIPFIAARLMFWLHLLETNMLSTLFYSLCLTHNHVPVTDGHFKSTYSHTKLCHVNPRKLQHPIQPRRGIQAELELLCFNVGVQTFQPKGFTKLPNMYLQSEI